MGLKMDASDVGCNTIHVDMLVRLALYKNNDFSNMHYGMVTLALKF